MRTLTAALVAASIILAAGSASALGAQPRQVAPGVFADPSTPAGKQYALQLQQARGTGASPSSTGQSGAQRFGSGIASSRPSPAQPAGRPATPATPASKPVHRSLGGTTPTADATQAGLAARSGGGGGGGGTLALVGGAAVILAISGLAALLLRHRRPLAPTVERHRG
jgi:hypothetical protein